MIDYFGVTSLREVIRLTEYFPFRERIPIECFHPPLCLERAFGADFARPEFQLAVQNNTVVNNDLTIVILAEEARQFEREAEPVRESVRTMFSKYRPTLTGGNGNGEKVVPDVTAQAAESVAKPPIERWPGKEKSRAPDSTRERVKGMYARYRSEQTSTEDDRPLIDRKAGDEERAAFWRRFAAGDSGQPVESNCAEFVVRQILAELVGMHRVGEVRFKADPVTVGDVLAVIERLCGGSPAGWQRLQKKAGIQPWPGA